MAESMERDEGRRPGREAPAHFRELEEAQTALRASEERYRTLFTAMDQGFCVIEKVATAVGAPSDFRYLAANPAFERHTGLRDIVGKTILQVVPNAERSIMDRYDRVAQTRQSERFEAYVSALDLWMEADVFPTLTPGQIAVLFSNVSERKRAELALRENEAQFRALVSLVPALLWQVDPRGQHITWNPRWLEYTGQAWEQSQRGGWLEAIHPEDRPHTARVFAEAFTAQREVEVQHRIRRHDGEYRWFLVRQVPLKDEQGQVVQWFGAALDIQEQRREQERAQHEERERLEEQVQATSEALGQTRAELRVLSGHLLTVQEEERRHLARELHDDFAQRTTVIEMQAERLAQHLAPTDAESQKLLREMRAQVSVLSRELREASHRLHPSILEDLGLAVALRSLVTDFQENGMDVALRMEDVPQPIPREAATALYRVAQEALRNVARHAAEAPVYLTLHEKGGELQLVVEDAGPGFDWREAKAKGGLGLLSMQERARLAGGTLLVRTAAGEGTLLLVRIPLTPEP